MELPKLMGITIVKTLKYKGRSSLAPSLGKLTITGEGGERGLEPCKRLYHENQ